MSKNEREDRENRREISQPTHPQDKYLEIRRQCQTPEAMYGLESYDLLSFPS